VFFFQYSTWVQNNEKRKILLLYRLHNSLVAEIKKFMSKQSLGKIFRTASKVNDPKKLNKNKKISCHDVLDVLF
jgi:hypothetical protein